MEVNHKRNIIYFIIYVIISIIGGFLLKMYLKFKLTSTENYSDLISQFSLPASYLVKYLSFYLLALTLIPLLILLYGKKEFQVSAALSLSLLLIVDFFWIYILF